LETGVHLRAAVGSPAGQGDNHGALGELQARPLAGGDLQLVGGQLELLAGHVESGVIINFHKWLRLIEFKPAATGNKIKKRPGRGAEVGWEVLET